MNFVHLRLHTEYSLSDSTIPLKALIKAVADKGMAAVAVTDLNNLFAMVKFYRLANGAGIKPIFGVDIYLDSGEDKPFNMILLAQDHAGYLNLCRLISEGYLKGQRLGIPRVTVEWVKRYSEGVIALSGGVSGDVGKALIDGNIELAAERALQWRDIFPNRYYLELNRTGRAGDEEQLHAAVDLALQLDLPVVATNDVRFVAEDNFYSHEARTCISAGYVLDDPNRPKNYSEQQYLRSAEEMTELFADIPEALANTVEIAKRCNMELTLGKNYLPDFPIPEGMTMADFFAEESRKGLDMRLATIFDTNAPEFAQQRIAYDERLEIELNVINGMEFPGYFLIVADFIQWAKDNDIPVGPGRGSGAGSLVAYALKITDLDPLPYDLLFERFLNPERISMPDFDIDFCMDGRDKVIDYVARTYGRDKVSQIITYGSMAAKAVVRDVGRVLGHGYGFVDSIAKQIPFEIGMTLTKALDQAEDLKERYDNNDEVRNLLDLALSLEGLSRNAGKHAGGVLISPTALTDFTPLYCEEDGSNVVSQYDKNDVEAVGLVKFDFLGLRNLTIIDWALKMINARLEKNNKPLVDITQISLEDRAAFSLLKACRTTAVFQLESRGMKELIKRLQPDVFEDIIALVALYRPGPLGSGMVDDFVDRKHGKQKVEYPHPELAPVLEPTYGVILYQEQVMQIAQVLASYSLGGADLLRRAMGKKKPEEMEKQRTIFMKGALKKGLEEENATYIFDLMEKFSGYGFNKSHSAAYALVSYQTAWLKAHYPAEFMAAVLSSDMDTTEKVVNFIDDCRQMKIKVVPPNVNRSEYKFTVDDEGCIVYGLGAVKGIGGAAIDVICENRQQEGEFTSLIDLCKRMTSSKVSRRVYETLISSGALDVFGKTRRSLMGYLPDAMRIATQYQKDQMVGQVDLFGGATQAIDGQEADIPQREEWPDRERLNKEKVALGLYLTGHPLDAYAVEVTQLRTHRLCDLDDLDGSTFNKVPVLIVGIVSAVRLQATEQGKRAFVQLDDGSAYLEVFVFSNTFEQYGHLIEKDELLIVEGVINTDRRTGSTRLRISALHDMNSARDVFARQLLLKIEQSAANQRTIEVLQQVLHVEGRRDCNVFIHYETEQATAQLRLNDVYSAPIADDELKQLQQLLGKKSVKMIY